MGVATCPPAGGTDWGVQGGGCRRAMPWAREGRELGVLAAMGGVGQGAECGLGTSCPPLSFIGGSLPTTICTAPGPGTLGWGVELAFGIALLPPHPAGSQLVGFTGCAVSHLRLGTNPKGRGTIPTWMVHSVIVWLETPALRDMGTGGPQVQGLLHLPVCPSSGAASVAPCPGRRAQLPQHMFSALNAAPISTQPASPW